MSSADVAEPLVDLLRADREERARAQRRRTRLVRAILWDLADDLGRLRRSGTVAPWILDDMAGRLEVALNLATPTAGELVRRGIPVGAAVEDAISRGERFRRAIGEDED